MSSCFTAKAAAPRTKRLSIRTLGATLVLAVVTITMASAHGANLKDIRVGSSAAKQRIVFEIDRNVPFRVLHLTAPDRLVVDFQNVAVPAPSLVARANATYSQNTSGAIQSFKVAAFTPNVLRAVVQVSAPFSVLGFDRLIDANTKTSRLYVDIDVGGDLKKGKLSELYVSSDWTQSGTASLNRAPSANDLKIIKPRLKGVNKFKIVIDPGHGGVDPGTVVNPAMPEKNVVLDFSLRLQEKLEKLQTTSVYLTRTSDRGLALRERYEFAEEKGAHLFVSIHADSISDRRLRRSVSGLTLYTLSQRGGDQIADAIARAENRSDVLHGFGIDDAPDPVVNVALRMLLEAKARDSRDIAHKILDRIGKKQISISNVPHRTARFVVLKSVKIPSILIEIGYLSNPVDASNLANDSYKDRLATVLATAIDSYFQSMS